MINEIKKWRKKGMLYLKEANFEDVEKEYEFIVNTPADENGFTHRGTIYVEEDNYPRLAFEKTK